MPRGTISPNTQFMALSRCAHYGGWDAMELVEGGGETSMELVEGDTTQSGCIPPFTA